ncbi:MAG: hypothetical protein RLZZ24_690 [Pseudomonadota bacterium]
MGPQRFFLDDARLHLQHGPIDIVIGADGLPSAVAAAHEAAWQRFETLLSELVAELSELRQPVQDTCRLHGPVARRMWQACHPFRENFITPMAAVAGSVAQELLPAYQRDGVRRAWINNGGDIALHLTNDEAVQVGLYADIARLDAQQLHSGLSLDGRFSVAFDSPIRGIATSGWRGRSFSLGIADSVTVLAATAAQADAAATVIGNAVNCDDVRIERRRASDLRDDSDLGDMAVTTHVPPLEAPLVQAALQAGLACANRLKQMGLISQCLIVCQGWHASTMDQEPLSHTASTLCQEPA